MMMRHLIVLVFHAAVKLFSYTEGRR